MHYGFKNSYSIVKDEKIFSFVSCHYHLDIFIKIN